MNVIGVRAARNAPLLIARCDNAKIERGEIVLLADAGEVNLAYVVLAPNDILNEPPPTIPEMRVLAVGRGSGPVAAALERRRQTTLGEAQAIAGAEVTLVDVKWADDLGRLTVVVADSADEYAELRRRLAEHFRTAVRVRR